MLVVCAGQSLPKAWGEVGALPWVQGSCKTQRSTHWRNFSIVGSQQYPASPNHMTESLAQWFGWNDKED